MNPEDEPLDQWAARREGRLRKPGELKAVTLGPGPQRAAHVGPSAPRLILEWDGFQWVPVRVVDDYAAASTPRPSHNSRHNPRPRSPVDTANHSRPYSSWRHHETDMHSASGSSSTSSGGGR